MDKHPLLAMVVPEVRGMQNLINKVDEMRRWIIISWGAKARHS